MENARINTTWFQLTEAFNSDRTVAEKWFSQMANEQNAEGRHYHTFKHVGHLLELIEQHEHQLSSPEVLRFAAFFHDHVYVAGSSNNERKSADVSLRAMIELKIPESIINRVIKMILATKLHTIDGVVDSSDTLFFIDMDMAILGSSQIEYGIYRKGVDSEFANCSSYFYRRGRAQFLSNMLSSPFIFQTEVFRNRFELTARQNLLNELEQLRKEQSTLSYRALLKVCTKYHAKSVFTY